MTAETGPDPGALTAGPLGRAMLAELAGVDRLRLLAAAGRPVPPGVAFLRAEERPGLRARWPRRTRRGATGWPEWMNPGGGVTELIGSAVAEAVRISPNERWFTDPLALLGPVATTAAGWAFGSYFSEIDPLLAAAAAQFLPLAETVAAAPAAAWWRTPADRRHQRWLGCEHRPALARGDDVIRAIEAATEQEPGSAASGSGSAASGSAASGSGSAAAVAASPPPAPGALRGPAAGPPPAPSAGGPAVPAPFPGPDVPVSGAWWSGPVYATTWTSRGPIGGLPAVGLAVAEDPLGEEDFEVWAVGIDPAARVYEVHGPDDWAALVAAFPRDVTASRRADWTRWTGHTGMWLLPDWPSVAREWDGVHVSVAGYLSTAGMALGIEGAATLLAGWDADQTLWLRDVFTGTRHLETWYGEPGAPGQFVTP